MDIEENQGLFKGLL